MALSLIGLKWPFQTIWFISFTVVMYPFPTFHWLVPFTHSLLQPWYIRAHLSSGLSHTSIPPPCYCPFPCPWYPSLNLSVALMATVPSSVAFVYLWFCNFWWLASVYYMWSSHPLALASVALLFLIWPWCPNTNLLLTFN